MIHLPILMGKEHGVLMPKVPKSRVSPLAKAFPTGSGTMAGSASGLPGHLSAGVRHQHGGNSPEAAASPPEGSRNVASGHFLSRVSPSNIPMTWSHYWRRNRYSHLGEGGCFIAGRGPPAGGRRGVVFLAGEVTGRESPCERKRFHTSEAEVRLI